MKDERIATVLKCYRKKNDISVGEVVKYLSAHIERKQYSAKTIYGWEAGISQPAADVFLCLCELYGIEDVLGVFGWSEFQKKPEIKLTREEEEVVWAYRANKPMQSVIKKILDIK